MAGTTPNLGLYLPGGGSTGTWVPDEVADIDPLNQNYVTIDTWAGTIDVFRTAQNSRNQQYRGATAALAGVTGMVEGDTFKETDLLKRTWIYDGTNWVTNENGLFLIRPSSVVNAVANSDGSVSANNGATTFSLNGVFSSRFRKFRIEMFSWRSASSNEFFRLRNSGADYSGAQYNHSSVEGNGTTASSAGSTTATEFPLNAGAGERSWGHLDVLHPALNSHKGLETDVASGTTIRVKAVRAGWISGQDATIFDGITFLITGGPTYLAGGWVKVYGLA